ncbi:CAP GLY domain containing protein [Trichuris trichiura]|uniref:CAP GLY domain containing protein n=1 Tax=Trichuris trichiura TaxID=36087 RepID=A0A077ZI45_TRITR|nr:CAP GLY domain containing protein [Trichuris trichiura]
MMLSFRYTDYHSAKIFSAAPSSWSVGSPSATQSVPPTPSARVNLRLGDQVVVSGYKQGTLRYLGTTDFAAGVWAGIELDQPYGKNDGSVQGKRYFACKPSYGLFAPVEKVEIPWNAGLRQKTPIVRHNIASLIRTRRNQSLRGSQESLTSISSVHSSASRRIRLGVSALSTSCTPSVKHLQQFSKEQLTDGSPMTVAMKTALKEKERHIDQLLKERDIERTEMAQLTQLMEQRERELKIAREDGAETANQLQEKIEFLENAVGNTEKENKRLLELLEVEKQKNDDLSFRLDEEMCLRNEMKVKLAEQEEHIARLTAQVELQGSRCIELENRLASLQDSLQAANAKPQVVDAGQQCDQELNAVSLKALVVNVTLRFLKQEGHTASALCRLEGENAKLDELLKVQLNLLASCQEKMDFQSSTIQKLTDEVDRMKIQSADPSPTVEMVSESASTSELLAPSDVPSNERSSEETDKSCDTLSLPRNETLSTVPSAAGVSYDQSNSEGTEDKLGSTSTSEKETSANVKSSIEVFDDPERIKQVNMLEDEIKRVTQLLQARESETEDLKASLEQRANECKRLENEFASFRSEMNHLREEKRRSSMQGCNEITSKNQCVSTDDLAASNGFIARNGSVEDDNEEIAKQRQHVAFLESIIADQQVKIENLKNHFEDNLKLNNTAQEKKMTCPRKYCDFCEIFDSHELEECDKFRKKVNESSNHTSYGFPRGHERSYCTACEMFGHIKEQCPSSMPAIL